MLGHVAICILCASGLLASESLHPKHLVVARSHRYSKYLLLFTVEQYRTLTTSTLLNNI